MRNTYVANYRKARADLLLMAVLTTINMVLLMVDAKYAFAFSATFPQLSVALGLELAEEFGSAALVIGAVMGFASIGLYYLCWALSKRHPGAIIAALVLFSLDTVLMFWFFELDSAWIDIVFHVAVLVYLIIGTVAVVKLRHLPPEEAVPGAAMPAAAVPQPYTAAQQPYAAQPAPAPVAQQPYAAQPAPAPVAQQPYAAQPAPAPAAQQPYAAQPAPAPVVPQPSYVTQPMPVAGAQPVYTAPEAPAAVPPVPAAGTAPAVPDDGRLPADFPSASQK